MAVVLAFLTASCDRSVFFDQYAHVDEKGWEAKDALFFNVHADDTTQAYQCCVDLRNSVDYPFSNIYLSITTVFPDGGVAVDTNLEFVLAQPDGKWLGKQTGRYVDGRYPFGYMRFPKPGDYQFVISHAMRDSLLPGIKDLGLCLIGE